MCTTYTIDDLYTLEDEWLGQRSELLNHSHEASMPVGSQGSRSRSRKRATSGVATKRRTRRRFNKYERC